MKRTLQFTFLLICSLCSLTTFGAKSTEPVKYFEELSVYPEFTYNYISPGMLQIMGGNLLSASSHGVSNLPIQGKHLTSIENISTETEGQNEELWKQIRKIKKDKKMETLTTKKSDLSRYDVLVTFDKDHKKILNLMLITQHGGTTVDVIYMEGKIPVESIKYSFY